MQKDFTANLLGFGNKEKMYKADCLTGVGLAITVIGTIVTFISVLGKNSASKFYRVNDSDQEVLDSLQQVYEECESNVIR